MTTHSLYYDSAADADTLFNLTVTAQHITPGTRVTLKPRGSCGRCDNPDLWVCASNLPGIAPFTEGKRLVGFTRIKPDGHPCGTCSWQTGGPRDPGHTFTLA